MRLKKEHKLKSAVRLQKNEEEKKSRELQEQFERARRGCMLTLFSRQLHKGIQLRIVHVIYYSSNWLTANKTVLLVDISRQVKISLCRIE